MGQNKSTPASAYQNAKNLFQARVSEKVGAELSKRVNSWLDRNDSFVASFQSRYKSRSTSYRADAGSWYDSMSAQKTQSDTDAEEIRSMIRQYGSYLDRDWVSQVHDVLERGTDVQSQMISAALEDRDYWAQFGDEDTYNRWHTANMAAQDILNAADFEQYSQAGAAIRNPAPEDVADRGLIIGGKLIFGTKGQDVGNVVTMSREHADLLAMAEANGGGGYEHGLKSIYRNMTEDEVAIYNYYLGKGYESMADRYLESLEEELTRREAGGLIQRVQGNAFNESLLMAGEGLENFRAGVRDYFGSLADSATGREEATITPITPTRHAAAGIKENTKGVKRAAYDLISTTTNMLPSILASTAVGLINPVAGVTVGNALMGTSSAGNAYAEMRRLGYDADQAGLYGVLVGSSEIGLNYALGGISKLGGKVSGNAIAKAVEQVDHALARFAIEYGGRMASEGIEEGLQSVLEPIFKGIVTGEFEGIDVGEVAYSALLGALSAGLLEGPSAIGSTVGQVRDTKSLYTKEAPEGASRMELLKETIKNGRLDTEAVAALGAESLEIDPQSRAGKRIQTRLDKGKRVSGLTLDAAVRHNQRLMRDQSRDDGADPDTDPGQAAAGAVGAAESGGTGNGDTLHGRPVTGQNEGISEGSEVPDELKTVSKKYGGQAGAMVAAYKAEQDITAYDEAFGAAFEMGQAGVSEAYVDRSPLTAYLDPAQRSLARAAGVASQADAAKAKAEANAARVKAGERLGTEARAPRRGVLKSRDVSLQELQSQFNDTQRTAYKLLSGIAEATGIDIVLYRSEPDKAGFYTDAQGYFKREDNAIYLDVNAGINHARNVEDLSRYTVMRTFSHELTHFTEEWEPEAYNELRTAVMEAMEGSGADVNALIEARLDEGRAEGMTYEAASREVVAEAMTDILSDERSTFLTSLAEQNQTVFQKLKAKFRAFLAKIKAHFASLAENTSPEARAVKEQVGGVMRYMEDVVKAFDKAALQAVENYRAVEAAPSGTEIQLRETAETTGLSGTETEQMVESYGEGTHQEADDYARAFAEGVAYGKQNRNPADISKDSLLGSMNPFDRQKALEAGRMAAIAEEDRREAEAIRRKAPPRSADKQGKKGFVTLDLTDGKRLRDRSPRDQATYSAAKVLGEALQTDIVLHSTMGTTESGEKVNGKYDAGTNTIHVALDAGMDGRRTSLFTLSHEVTHHVRQWSPRKYQALSDFVGKHISQDMGALIEKKKALLQKQEDYQDMTDAALTEAAHEEVVADAMETVLSDGNVLEDLATYDKSLWERVKAWVTDAIRKVREVYRGLAPNSRAAQALQETVSSMDEIERLFAEGVREAGMRVRSATVASENNETGIQKYSVEYEKIKTNSDIIAMVEKIQSGDFKDNEKVPLGTVPTEIANKLYEITGIHVDGFKMAMEARQLEHILKDHGENGRSDRSMANPADIAKMGYILYKPDDIRPAGRTQAYSSMVNGRNRTADTVLYEKNIGDKSYYVVQAVPNTKAKTLYVVTAFIGKVGYKKEAPQLINVEHLDATPDNGSANTSVNSIAQNPASVNRKNLISQKTAADGRTKSPNVSKNAFDEAVQRMYERMEKEAVEAAERATHDPDTQQQRRTKDLSVRDVIAVGTESLRQTAGALSRVEQEALHGYDELLNDLTDLQNKRHELGQLYHKQQFGDQPDRAEAKKTLNRIRIMEGKIARAEQETREWEETKTMQVIAGKAQAIVDEMEQKNAAYVARRIENYRKREEIKKYKDRIKADAAEMTKWILHPSQKEDHKHVPDSLKDEIGSFLKLVDPTSQQQLAGKGPTKADVKFSETFKKLCAALEALDGEQVGENGGVSDLHPDFRKDNEAVIERLEALEAAVEREYKASRAEAAAKAAEEEAVKDARKQGKKAAEIKKIRAEAYAQAYSAAYRDAKAVDATFLINRMTAAELKELSRTVSRLRAYVVQYNRLYTNARYQHVYEAGDATISALQVMKSNDGRANGASNFLLWQQMRPELVFERFGEGGRAINRELRAGQAKLARNAKAIVDFAKATYSAKEVKAWEDQVVTVRLGQGERDMTVAQLMTLYKLAGQEDSKRHLLSPSGGFRAAGFKKRGQKSSDRVLPLSEADLEVVASTLTERQREVADKLQVFMEKTGGGWGNEITQARFGEDLFTIRHYFPIHVDSRALGSKVDGDKLESGGLYALLNKSFTKERAERAGKPLVIHSIFDVFATHMSDMAQYNALALPVLDTIKWLNYKQNADWVDDGPDYESGIRTSDTVSVRDQMTRVYGAPVERGGRSSTGYAVSFVENIIKALSGTEAQGSVYDNVGLKALRLHNRAQVAYNLRVVAQQPFAILRAGMVLDPTDILRGMKPGAKVMKQNVAEMREHSGIALWKSLGFYDVNISRGMGDIIKHKASVIDKFQDAGMAGAEFMDTATWAAIWSACKARVKKQGIKPSDGRFFPAVTELFEDVIYRTQVVDSVLTKNEFMRSKGFFARSVSSFMGEPTTTAGMLLNTYDEIHRDKLSRRTGKESFKKHAKLVGRTAMVWGAQAVVMAAVTAAIDGLRDDDEYEEYGEKWLEAFGGNLFDEAMPFGKLPIVSDVYDLSKELYATVTGSEDVYGNPPQSVYMQWWDSLVKGAEITMDRIKGEDTNYTWYAGIYKLLQAASGMAGVSAGPIVREVVTTYNNLIVPAWNEVIARSAPSLRLETVRTYDPGDEADIRNAYRDGDLTEEEAISRLLEKGLAEDEYDAHFTVRGWSEADYSRFGALDEAVRWGGDITEASAELTAHGYTEKALLEHMRGQIGKWYREGEIDRVQAQSLLEKYGDLDGDTIEARLAEWSCVVETGTAYGDIKEAYLAGEITRGEAMEMYIRYGGKTEEEAEETLVVIDFVEEHPACEGISYPAVTAYEELCEPCGIALEVFMEAWRFNSSTEADKDRNGKTISGTKKAKVLDYVDGLDLTRRQKKALGKALGYGD